MSFRLPSAALRRALPVTAIIAAAASIPLAVYLGIGETEVMVAPWIHLVVVGTAGALAAVLALAMSIIAARLNDGRAVLLGFAFSVMAVMLLIHGLATPGMLLGDNGLVQVTGALNLPFGGAILAAAALPALRRPRNGGELLRIQVATLSAIGIAGAVLLVAPQFLPVQPRPDSFEALAIFSAGAVVLAPLAWRAGRTYLLTRRASDVLVAIGIVLLIGAEYGLLAWDMEYLSWWAAHALEVGGIGLVGIPAALDLRHANASRPLFGDLRVADLVAHEEAFLGGRVHALMLRLADKDPSTAGHTRRVATLAVQIGESLGLPADRLRLLALGGLLHDMGKLAVPDEILNKPGKLDDDEFAVIRRHPAQGRELLNELGGFPPLVLALVESHHERIDGLGYPHAAAAGEMELEVRILTVADVYDALTADRVYREAWSSERALTLLDGDSGSAFDAHCVAALRGVVDPGQDGPGFQAGLAEAAPAGPPAQPAPRAA
jgi:HD-GYP domain-containing protein (c-di-GMP phosphodiesterase class II)